MGKFLIVDGYNIINAWQDLKSMAEEDLDFAREALLETLSECRGLLWENIILIFDAYYKKGRRSKEERDGITIIYTQKGETADELIESLVYDLVLNNKIEVATSDWLEQKMVMGKGAIRVSARELKNRILQFKTELRKDYLNQNNYKNSRNVLCSRMNEKTFKELEKFRKKGGGH